MNLSQAQTDALLRILSLTKDQEATCEDCLQHLAEFAELALAGKSVPENLKSIEEHMQLCVECVEEYESLKAALHSGPANP